MLKEITTIEALKRYIDGEDIKILAPMVNNPDWLEYEAGLLSRLLDGIIFMMDEEDEEPISAQEPEELEEGPEPESDPKSKYAPKNLDNGKIGALHKAGWSNEKIAEEMGTTGVTIGKRLKAMKERGDL